MKLIKSQMIFVSLHLDENHVVNQEINIVLRFNIIKDEIHYCIYGPHRDGPYPEGTRQN